MSNRDLYKRSFDKLGPTEKFQKEINAMMDNKNQTSVVRRILPLVAAVVVILSLAVAASAAGVFENVRLWINGQEVDPSGYIDENGDLVVEASGEGRVDILFTDELEGEEDVEVRSAPDIAAEYQNRDGRDYLCFTNIDTGDIEEIDITGKLVDGCYQDMLTVFGCICQVEVTVGEYTFSFNLSVEGFAE